MPVSSHSNIPKRHFHGDVDLSIVGMGGIVVLGQNQKDANRIVAESIERGVNYFDVAPTYGDGEAEEKLGRALKRRRQQVFLACKTGKRDAKGAREELEGSLKRLQTDHFDLYQFHAVTSMDDVEQITAPDGAGELFLKAREEGKVRFLGFSAHGAEAARELMNRFPCDSVLFPVNFVCYAQGNFGPQIMQKAKERGVARLALKVLAHTRVPEDAQRPYHKCWYAPVEDAALAREAFRFALSQEITVAIPPGEEKFYRQCLDFASAFEPLSLEEEEELLASTRGLAPIFRAEG